MVKKNAYGVYFATPFRSPPLWLKTDRLRGVTSGDRELHDEMRTALGHQDPAHDHVGFGHIGMYNLRHLPSHSAVVPCSDIHLELNLAKGGVMRTRAVLYGVLLGLLVFPAGILAQAVSGTVKGVVVIDASAPWSLGYLCF